MTQAESIIIEHEEALVPTSSQETKLRELLNELSQSAHDLLERSVIRLPTDDTALLTAPVLARKTAEIRNISGEIAEVMAHAQSTLKMIDLKLLGLKAKYDSSVRTALRDSPRVKAKISSDERKEAAKALADEELGAPIDKWQKARAECDSTLEILRIIYREIDHARTDVGRASDIWRTQIRLET